MNVVQDHFDTVFRTPISTVFFYMGKDDYSKFTKVTTFLLLVLIPVFVTVIGGLSNFILNVMDGEHVPPQLVPINLTSRVG